jgi:hypothetical protein
LLTILQFKSLFDAIASCVMAIVNGVVAICKAIIDVSTFTSQQSASYILTHTTGDRGGSHGHRELPDLRQGGQEKTHKSRIARAGL